VVRGGAPFGLLGAAMARLPRAVGDLVVMGAPASLPPDPGPTSTDGGVPAASSAPPGAAFLIQGATIIAIPSLRLGSDGQPAAEVALGADPGDAFGAALAVGDFNQSGYPDVAVGASGSRKVYLILDPTR
jgi:hypothetical protein